MLPTLQKEAIDKGSGVSGPFLRKDLATSKRAAASGGTTKPGPVSAASNAGTKRKRDASQKSSKKVPKRRQKKKLSSEDDANDINTWTMDPNMMDISSHEEFDPKNSNPKDSSPKESPEKISLREKIMAQNKEIELLRAYAQQSTTAVPINSYSSSTNAGFEPARVGVAQSGPTGSASMPFNLPGIGGFTLNMPFTISPTFHFSTQSERRELEFVPYTPPKQDGKK